MVRPMDRVLMIMAGAYGALAVGLGAFGAHGLRGKLELLADGAKRLEWWQTAAHYHLVHALAIGLCAWAAARFSGSTAPTAGFLFAAGVLLFSGSLYVMTLTGIRGLGAITPLGGLLLIAGWVALAFAALKG